MWNDLLSCITELACSFNLELKSLEEFWESKTKNKTISILTAHEYVMFDH